VPAAVVVRVGAHIAACAATVEVMTVTGRRDGHPNPFQRIVTPHPVSRAGGRTVQAPRCGHPFTKPLQPHLRRGQARAPDTQVATVTRFRAAHADNCLNTKTCDPRHLFSPAAVAGFRHSTGFFQCDGNDFQCRSA
jgi:hypothetical protein